MVFNSDLVINNSFVLLIFPEVPGGQCTANENGLEYEKITGITFYSNQLIGSTSFSGDLIGLKNIPISGVF